MRPVHAGKYEEWIASGPDARLLSGAMVREQQHKSRLCE